MRTDIESLWVFALASKCKSFTSIKSLCFALIILLIYLVMNIIYWLHPGGPAWGKHTWKKLVSQPIPGPKGFPVIGSMNLMATHTWKKLVSKPIPGPKRFPVIGSMNLMATHTWKKLVSKPIPGPKGFPVIGSMNLMATHTWKKLVSKPIPGPKGFPIIGSMNLMTGLAHRKIAVMAKTLQANRLMCFSLGETRVIVTCNPDVAKEILNSSVFADRPVKESAYRLMFNRAIGFASYGVYWSTLRKIAANHLFSPKQIKISEKPRSQIAKQLITMFKSSPNNILRVRDALKLASLNNMMCSVFGKFYDLDSLNSETEELIKLVDEGYELLGMLNWSDHISWLAEFDPQRIKYRCSELVPKVNRFVRNIIDEHMADQSGETHGDFVDVLLSLQGSERLSESDMIAVLWEMIFRGTDTVAVLVEWILARMVLNPDVQSKVQVEIDRVVGRSRAVIESDISKMIYLNAVVKEVLRLHPPGPLLSWSRLAITDTTVDGYHVPAGTTAMVNMWAITRDADVWADPLMFKPERFVNEANSDVDFSILGSDTRLAPFGSGRRSCPGKTLGLTTVTFWVATLLHEFEFGLNNNVDLSEVLKLSCTMAHPLMVKIRSRRTTSN